MTREERALAAFHLARHIPGNCLPTRPPWCPPGGQRQVDSTDVHRPCFPGQPCSQMTAAPSVMFYLFNRENAPATA